MNRNIRLGRLNTVSNDKGPHKMMEVECDGKMIMAKHLESFGMQSSAHKDADCLIFCPDGDEGKAYAMPMPRPKDRKDQQKEGETTHHNPETGNEIQHNVNKDTLHNSNRHIVMKTKGILFVNCDA